MTWKLSSLEHFIKGVKGIKELGGSLKSFKERIQDLADYLNEQSKLYYSGTPGISDKEFDTLYDGLKTLEEMTGFVPENSPTKSVGANVSSELAKVKHEFPALSLAKTKDVMQLCSAMAKGEHECKEKGTVLMWKCDGLTVQATYENGKLIQAATRGDGEIGEDITHNAPFINGLPMNIVYKGKLVVRGEAMISYAELERVNAELEAEGATELYANCRNLASATIRLTSEGKNTKMRGRKVDFFAFSLVYSENASTHFYNQLEWLYEIGFQTVPHSLYYAEEPIFLEDGIAAWSKPDFIEAFGYPVDGLVIALNNASYAAKMPATDKHPHVYQGYALKWQDETIETILKGIEWSASRTGLLNPVACFEPVNLCGTTVSRASLHNISYIREKNLLPGDKVTVYKANMIIPQIDENLDADKHGPIDISLMGKWCPCCKHETVIIKSDKSDTLVRVCENPACPAKQIGIMTHFAERDCMNIIGLSEAKITDLVNLGAITDRVSILKLPELYDEFGFVPCEHHIPLREAPGWGVESEKNLVEAVRTACEDVTFVSFVHALGIPNIGKGQAKAIRPTVLKLALDSRRAGADENGEEIIPDLVSALIDAVWRGLIDFEDIEGIGEKRAKSLVHGIELLTEDSVVYAEDTCELLEMTKRIHFRDEIGEALKQDTSDSASKISGKTFVITGSLEHYPNRDALVAEIESLGGKVAGSVSKNTSYLINNDVTSTSGKNKKAHELGVPIVSEVDYLAMKS